MELFLFLVCIPLMLAIPSGLCQKKMAEVLDGRFRPLLLLLPGVSAAAALVLAVLALTSTGWMVFSWAINALWAVGALIGSLVGWRLGRRKEPV